MVDVEGEAALAGDERLKLLRARPATGEGAPGQVLSGPAMPGLVVACGTGAVEITLAQREGKRPMAASELLRGMTLPERLG